MPRPPLTVRPSHLSFKLRSGFSGPVYPRSRRRPSPPVCLCYPERTTLCAEAWSSHTWFGAGSAFTATTSAHLLFPLVFFSASPCPGILPSGGCASRCHADAPTLQGLPPLLPHLRAPRQWLVCFTLHATLNQETFALLHAGVEFEGCPSPCPPLSQYLFFTYQHCFGCAFLVPRLLLLHVIDTPLLLILTA
jgi:hypothetical protein